jgi:putative transposase
VSRTFNEIYKLAEDLQRTAEWCTRVLKKAIGKHSKPEIFNTNQRSQYTSEVRIKLLINNYIKISIDEKGRAIDNIFIERLWRIVKYENVYFQAYTSTLEL